ncbi:RagB/SusD family nutrient uptake outer membrane protein [uncultured Aquimarina sp.]|uniref:RagB/SusD family nutrient uptake outer membrane protein n=1 Tax=uncultured Aquimarina sp. TaxID=575652 RepID=UPI0026367885|nr:RagB/SusD family nutrient uptake outer membrane protein [uncultured Aquimarina sp.]
MKNKFYISTLFISFLICMSCADEFVDTESENNVQGVENQIVNASTAEDALVGMYDDLQDADLYSGTMNYYLGMWADEQVHSGSFPAFSQIFGNDPDSENINNNNMWNAFYNTIFAANNLIKVVNTDLQGITEGDVARITGQAYGLRALMYFNLIRIYGPVPLDLEANQISDDLDAASALPRFSEQDVYNQINSDILQSISLLDGVLDRSVDRFSRDAARTLQAQVALQLNDLVTAQTALELLLNAGYGLATNVSDLYGGANSGLVLSPIETIFGIPYSATDGSTIAFFFSDQPDGGRDEVRFSGSLSAAFEPGDERASSLINPSSGISRISKYTQAGTGDDDVYVFRYADVLLMLAEVYAKQDDARASGLINQVRDRAGLPDTVLNSGNVNTLIPRERFVEFFAESGDRYHTLKRFDLLDAVVQNKGNAVFIAERNNLFPIPQNELDNNTALSGSDQNAGY